MRLGKSSESLLRLPKVPGGGGGGGGGAKTILFATLMLKSKQIKLVECYKYILTVHCTATLQIPDRPVFKWSFSDTNFVR
jgi:uncharacterized spore protein YtfJ